MKHPEVTEMDNLQDKVAPLIAGAVFYMRKLQQQLVEIENVLKEFNVREKEARENGNSKIRS